MLRSVYMEPSECFVGAQEMEWSSGTVMLFLHQTTLHLATMIGYNEVEMFLTRSIMSTDH